MATGNLGGLHRDFSPGGGHAGLADDRPGCLHLVYRSRCIFPSTGFFEHHHIMRGAKDVTVPFHIRVKHEPVFGMAALMTTWVDKETGELIPSFSVITTVANELMARIHNMGPTNHRMPLILDRSMEEAWLDPESPRAIIDEILNYRISADQLTAWPVQSIRKRGRPDGPELLERVEIPEIDWA